jgi:hypothetical protein
VQVQSTMSTVPLAEVLAAGRGAPLMLFQLYVFRDRAFTQRLVQRALPLTCLLPLPWASSDSCCRCKKDYSPYDSIPPACSTAPDAPL